MLEIKSEESVPQQNWPNLSRGKLIIFLSLIILGLLTVFFLSLKFREKPTLLEGKKPDKNLTTPIPSPMPFYELTIPYLRERTFKSSLADLKIAYERPNYIAYLTSYLSDGIKINGLLTKPKGETPLGGYPAIVFVHGYIPPTQYKTLEKYVDHVDYLAKSGFVVFKIDLRGHGDSGGDPGGGYYSSDYVIDTLNAYAALESADFISPNKIGLWGHSMAGNLLMRAFAAKVQIPAVVIWSGAGYSYLDLNTYGISDNSYTPLPSDTERVRKRQQLRELYGNPQEGNPFWKLVAPTNYLTDLKGAIQLDHAINDEVVSVEYSRNLNNLLNKTTVPHELNEFQNGGHNISGGSFNEAIQKTVEFFKNYLR